MLALLAALGVLASSCSQSSSADDRGLTAVAGGDPATSDDDPGTGARAETRAPGLLVPLRAAATAASDTIPVTAEGAGTTPEGGHPPAPRAGMIPRRHPYWNHPDCAPGPPRASDCYPPTEWETPQDLSDCFAPRPELGAGGICASGPTDELPRWTRDVVGWTSWCFDQPRGNCTWLLYEMKWALDYLGAHPWCVLNEYQERADAYGSGARGKTVQNRHGWHNCASVIDPPAADPPAGRFNDAGLLLSDTVSLAEQCRIVLPADVELETRTSLFGEQPEQRFGSDCGAWARWVQNRPKGRERRDCDRSARLAEEWMEHHHATPERYFIVYC
ncbi:MAG: hypothetical protein OXD37_07640 [Acidimicrobiaceae bacterium]|nr:hypothetical protein [Acidimicrobiaceae bacterium]